jgi:hypothetical protein
MDRSTTYEIPVIKKTHKVATKNYYKYTIHCNALYIQTQEELQKERKRHTK